MANADRDKNRNAQAAEVLRLIGRDPELLASAMHRAETEGMVLGRAAGLLEAADLARETSLSCKERTTDFVLGALETALQARAQLALDGQG